MDTSVFIEGWRRHYPPDVFAIVWDRLDELIRAGVVRASEEVREDLARKDDEVYAWCEQRPQLFIPSEEAIQQAVRQILSDPNHSRLIDTRRNRSGSDPFVIAVAQVESLSVVTYEQPSGSATRPHIPDVCIALNVRAISFVEMLRERGL